MDTSTNRGAAAATMPDFILADDAQRDLDSINRDFGRFLMERNSGRAWRTVTIDEIQTRASVLLERAVASEIFGDLLDEIERCVANVNAPGTFA